MQGSSRQWSYQLFDQFIRDLCSQGWRVRRRTSCDIDFYHLTSGQSLLVRVQHWFPEGMEQSTVLISDVVCLEPFAKQVIGMYPEIFGEFYVDFRYQNRLPTKRFNCFINRGCPFRQSWLYQLVRQGLLEQGHVSYWCEDRFGTSPPREYFETLFQGNKNFAVEHEYLRHKIPFKNFDMCLEDAIIDSTVSIVLETWFQDNNLWIFSEKTWRNLQMPRPWLLMASKHSVKYLRNLGFDVLDDYVDHGYDDITDPVHRQMAIISQVVNMRSLTNSDLKDLEQRAQHNRDKLLELKRTWPIKYQNILGQIKSISKDDSPA